MIDALSPVPLLRNGCAATVSAADVAFLASESNCGEVRWTRSVHADCCNQSSGRIVTPLRQRSIGISMQTLLRDADRDGQRQKWDASSARPGGKREPVLAGVIPFRKTRNPVSTSEEVMRSCPTVTSAVRRQQGDSNM